MASIRKRKSKDGKVSYTVQVRRKGHKPAVATFARREDADRYGRDTERKVEQGRYAIEDEASRRTVKQAITKYLDEMNEDHKDSATRAQQLGWWRDQIGDLTMSAVTPAVLSDCKSTLLREPYTRSDRDGAKEYKRSGSTANRYMAAFSHVLACCEKEWQWITMNPMRAVKKLKEPRGRDRFLSEEELPRLLHECKISESPHLHTIVLLGVLTGARKNELRTLTWKQIDLKKKRATIHKTKNGEIKVLHLPAPAIAVLEEHGKVRRVDTDLVFPSPTNARRAANQQREWKPSNVQRAWKTALKRAKVPNFRFHDLRHTAASYLAMNGATSGEIAEVLGHKTLQMVKRYAHLSEKHVGSVVDRMAEKVFGEQVKQKEQS